MPAQILDGKILAQNIRGRLRETIVSERLKPGLAVVLVGQNPASQVYVRNKIRACAEVGVESFAHHLPEDTSEAMLRHLLDQLNADPQVHGVLVQLPLPKALAHFDVTLAIAPEKDVDGFHPESLGKLMTGRPGFKPCTPYGVMKLIEHAEFPLQGRHAVVVGRSNIVGKPMALLLLEQNATVTICHSKTRDLAEQVARADLLVAAVGIPEFIRGAWVKPGALVVDVGINRRADGSLCGDVEYAAAAERAEAITPVPGGVGPMTIAMLLSNTVEAARRRP